MRYLSIGHKVMVHIPAAERQTQSAIAKYHEQEMVVANRVAVGKLREPYYELVGAKSEWGIPYAFVKDWLIPL